MPEWGWRGPLKGAPSWSKRSRNTNGFRISPKSDGLIKRVAGPCFRPRVRRTIARAKSHACAATPSGEATACALFGSVESDLQVRDGGRRAQDAAAIRSRTSGVAIFPGVSPEKAWGAAAPVKAKKMPAEARAGKWHKWASFANFSI